MNSREIVAVTGKIDGALTSPRYPRIWQFAVIALITISVVLRLWLTASGGQHFFGDEGRYDRGVQLYVALLNGDSTTARQLSAWPEHSLFIFATAAITAAQHALAQLTPYGDWSKPENVVFTEWLGALVLSLFSALNLFWIWRLARVTGASEPEATGSLLLASASVTLFYPARHLLPYSFALSIALAALVVGLGGNSRNRSILAGMLGALTFSAYNGFWYLPPVIGLAWLAWWRGKMDLRSSIVAWAGGSFVGLALPMMLGTVCGGREYWETFLAFSRSATLGVFAEGWSLPWEFYWHAEGWFGTAIAAGSVAAIVVKRQQLPSRVKIWALIVILSYVLLAFFSSGLERIVIYARTVLPFAPFFCLLGGWMLAIALGNRLWAWAVACLVVACVAFVHFKPHFTFVFPRMMEVATMRHYGNPKRTLSVSGSLYTPLTLPVTRPDLLLVNAQLLYPIRDYIGYPPGRVLLRIKHPLHYRPFQYESHTPRERALLRTHEIDMLLVSPLDADLPDDLPVPLRYSSEDRPTGHR